MDYNTLLYMYTCNNSIWVFSESVLQNSHILFYILYDWMCCSELKRRMKAEKKAKEKAEAAVTVEQPVKQNVKEDEVEIGPNVKHVF